MRKLLSTRLIAILLTLVMVIGLGTAAMGNPLNIPDGPFSLSVHHLLHPSGPGPFPEAHPGSATPPASGMIPIIGADWQIIRVEDGPNLRGPIGALTAGVWPSNNPAPLPNFATEPLAQAALAAALTANTITGAGAHTQTVTTVAPNGTAHFPNVPAGIYFVRQLPVVAGEPVLPPFLVSVPMYHFFPADPNAIPPTDAGYRWITNVHVFPKAAQADVGMSKVHLPNLNAGDLITWQVGFSLMPGLGNLGRIPAPVVAESGANTYIRIDDRLATNYLRHATGAERDAIRDSVVIEYLVDGGDPTDPNDWNVLTVGYEVAVVASPTPAGDPLATPHPLHPSLWTLRVDILQAGRNHLADEAYLAHDGQNIRIRLTAQTRADTPPGTEIPNLARLTYGPNPPEVPPPPPPVQVFGLRIFKHNPSDQPLAGATFRLYNQVNIVESPAASGNWIPRPANWPGAANPAAGTHMLITAPTGADGLVVVPAILTAGRYVLVEVASPAGYVLNVEPMTFEINAGNTVQIAGTNTYVREVAVLNTPTGGGFELPLTGGAGTILFTIIGLTLIGGSIVLLVAVRKRSK